MAHKEIKHSGEEEKALLLSVSKDIAAIRNKIDLFKVVSTKIRTLLSSQVFLISLINQEEQTQAVYFVDHEEIALQYPSYHKIRNQICPINDGVYNLVLESEEPVLFNIEELVKTPGIPNYVEVWHEMGREQMIAATLRIGGEAIGTLWIYSRQTTSKELLSDISAQLSVAISNILDNEKIQQQLAEINQYKQQLEEENRYLQQEIARVYNHTEIIGNSLAIQKVFHLLKQVSPTSSTVLLLGETGTGKELIARDIHNNSSRKDKLMVKVNCAALPANLIESELFGHEKGSFTGAFERRMGKFELANKGTLFLDEIGDMPLEMQVKLLRAIQEREIERVGGKTTIKVDVRIIAATNRNLLTEVEAGRFRSDLFYRLNVFPVTLPPLRERKEDIPVLTQYFIHKYSSNTGKRITGVSNKISQELLAYDWPGNIRELEHLIERSVIMAAGNMIKEIHLPLNDHLLIRLPYGNHIKTIEENERDHIIEVLNICKGKIYGPRGAAALLDIPVSTLNSRIKRLGIGRETIITTNKK